MNDNFELQVRWNGGKATVPEWTIQCDFDGTISLQDVTDTLLQRHGMPGWEDLEEAWERGEIGSRECMSGQVALLDMSVAELREALEQVHVDPGFVRFVDQARQLGIGVQVVSDGLDYAIQVILAREGMGDLPIVANRLLPAGPRRWKLETPWSRPDCASANCKCGQLAGQQAAASACCTWATAARTSASRARPSTCWPRPSCWITAAPTASCIPPSSTSTRRCRCRP